MQIFGFPTSPYVRKVLLIAAEKGIEVEIVPATPHKPTPEFLAASPFRMMPAMQDGDFSLPDSTAIAFYMDAKAPNPPMLPDDAQGRGMALWFDEFADTLLSNSARGVAFNRYIGPALLGVAGDKDVADEAEKAAHPALDWLEEQMPQDGWLLGDAISLADIAVASCLKTLSYGMDVTARPLTGAWYGRMSERPAWKDVRQREIAMIEGAKSSGEHKQD